MLHTGNLLTIAPRRAPRASIRSTTPRTLRQNSSPQGVSTGHHLGIRHMTISWTRELYKLTTWDVIVPPRHAHSAHTGNPIKIYQHELPTDSMGSLCYQEKAASLDFISQRLKITTRKSTRFMRSVRTVSDVHSRLVISPATDTFYFLSDRFFPLSFCYLYYYCPSPIARDSEVTTNTPEASQKPKIEYKHILPEIYNRSFNHEIGSFSAGRP